MKDIFITLTLEYGDRVFINPEFIESMHRDGDRTVLQLKGDKTWRVKESPEQICTLIERQKDK